MLTLYNPATQALEASSGFPVTDLQVQINILIELRVMNQLAVELANGNVNISLDGLRDDVVNDSANPIL